MNWLASYLMRGRPQAMMVAAVLALLSVFLPPVSIISSAAVALVTLRQGGHEGLAVWVLAAAIAALLGLLLLHDYRFGLVYALLLWLPTWLLAVLLRESGSLSLAIESAAVLCCLGVLGYYLYNPEIQQTWQSLLKLMLPDEGVPADIDQRIAVLAKYMTGIVGAGTTATIVFGLLLGRWWQALLYNPGGFRQEYLALTAHSALTLATLAVVAVASIASGLVAQIAWNLAIVLLVLYAMIGAAVMHSIFAAMKLAAYTVPMFYITLLLVPHALLPVALIGLTDAWLRLRKKHSKPNAP